MNTNLAASITATIAWDGAAATPTKIAGVSTFAWSFQTTAAIAADAVFGFQYADPSAADPCLPGPWLPVAAVATCGTDANGNATLTIPAGTAIGSHCSGTLPCAPGAFVRLVAVSGTTASVKAVLLQK
jgi:hypothetical protein